MLPYFVSFWLKGWNSDLVLETERHHIANFDVGGDEYLASKRSFDQVRPASMSPFQNGSSTSGILNKSTE